MIEAVSNQLEEDSKTFELFVEYSPGDDKEKEEALEKFNELTEKLKQTEIPKDNYDKAKHVLDFLERRGFHYDINVFSATEIFKNNGGNCVGLTLLAASLIEKIGVEVKIKSFKEVKDVPYRNAEKTLSRLMEGLGEVRRDSPLPVEEEDRNSFLRFSAVGHFLLEVEGQGLDVTDFGKEESEGEIERVGREKVLAPTEAISFVISSQIFNQTLKSNYDPMAIKDLAQKGLGLNPQEESLWSILYSMAEESFSDLEAEKSMSKYLELADQSGAFFYFNRYLRDHRPEDLERAYQIFPADKAFFMSKNVDCLLKTNNQEDWSEARYNFKIMAHCVANSEMENLADFYLRYGHYLGKFYSPEIIENLLKKVGAKEYDPWRYPLTMYLATRDPRHLKKAIADGLWPTSPDSQLIWAVIGDYHQIKKCQLKLIELKKLYGSSQIFQKNLASYQEEVML